MSLHATAAEAQDNANIIGVSVDAKYEWDRYDHVEPPAIGEYVSVSFPHYDWKEYPYEYTVDFRPPDDTISWDFDVKTNIPSEKVKIAIEGIQNLPTEYSLTVIDRDTGKNIKLIDGSFSFVSSKDTTERHYRLTVGKPGGGDTAREGQERFITAFCYPNPFNPQTTLRYELSVPATVKISLYNVVGQLVREYSLGQSTQGVHKLVLDFNGLTSGLYFYHVDAGYSSVTGKVLYMK